MTLGSGVVVLKSSTAATKSWTAVLPGCTVSDSSLSVTRFGPDCPDGTSTAAVPLLVTCTRV